MGIKLNTDDIQRLLNRSTGEISPDTLDKLQNARRTALQHQRLEKQSPVYAWLSEHGILGHHNSPQHKLLSWGMAVIFASILVIGIGYWQNVSEHDHSDIDIAILTDDLPVDMYVD